MDINKAREELMLGKTIYDMNLKVAVYSRVSKDKNEKQHKNNTDKITIDNLIDNTKNWTYVASYSDKSILGKRSHKGEEFLKMIEDAKLGKIDLILTEEISGPARNMIDSTEYALLLLDYGVGVYFISDNINSIDIIGETQLTLMNAIAKDELFKLSERRKNRRKFKEE